MSEVKLVLSPALRLFHEGDQVLLVSEKDRLEFPSTYASLLEQLREPTDLDDITEENRQHLEHLAQLRLLHSSSFGGLDRVTAAYWLAQGFPPNFTRDQLALGIEFAGPAAGRFHELALRRYPECKVVESQGKLLAYVTTDLLACDLPGQCDRPVVLIKTGGIKQSIGPVLSPAFGYAQLRARIERPFDADLSVDIPAGLQAAADHLLLTELYQLRVRAGAHKAVNHVVEWDLATLSKTFWKVKP